MRTLLLLLVVTMLFPVWAAEKGGLTHGLRGDAPLDAEPTPPPMPKMINDDQRRARAFPMQPPVIPHQIENYQVDRQFNKCMSCHGRDRVQDSQAPMVSVTHYVDRAGADRAEVSPRRYFCTQCHVPQLDVKPPVQNLFKDAAALAVKGQKK
jgi:cytochrome c-type protein NapB